MKVVGFDLNEAKINLYKSGVDPTKEVGDEVIKNTTLEFTADETSLKGAKFIIVAVPTPVNTDHTPDLTPVIGASEIVGCNLTKGSIVVYESTVYPGDKIHSLENIHKIVSGCDEESLEEIKNVYDIVIEVGTHPVSD